MTWQNDLKSSPKLTLKNHFYCILKHNKAFKRTITSLGKN